jgi:colicin import membrane protein
MTESTPYTVPKEPGRWRAITLAVLVHAALFIFLWVGVRWQSETPATIEAEVWSPEPREAAPAPPPIKQPEPVKEEPPKPVVRETPKPVVEEPPVKKPDIALEQEKKRKAELEKKRLEQERQEKLKQKAEEERLAKQKQKEEQDRLAKQKAEEQRIAKEKAAKKKAAEEVKRKQEEEQQKLLDKMHAEDMKRLETSLDGGTGKAAKAQGGAASLQYAARVQAKIKSNIIFNPPETLNANPAVEFEVDLLPDGSIAGMRKLKASGLPGWDEAVARAIEKSQPFPKDQSGKVPSSFLGIHRPKDK